MVLRSRTRGGRGSAAIPDVEVRPDVEFSQEPEIVNPAEIQVSMCAICEGGSSTTRLDIPETVSKYVTADRLETSAAFPASQKVVVESNPNYTTSPNTIPHNCAMNEWNIYCVGPGKTHSNINKPNQKCTKQRIQPRLCEGNLTANRRLQRSHSSQSLGKY